MLEVCEYGTDINQLSDIVSSKSSRGDILTPEGSEDVRDRHAT